MSIKLLFVISIQFLLAGQVFAVDEKGQFAVRTMGLKTCERYVSAKKSDAAALAAFLGWADGYLSASNQFTQKTYDIIPWGNTAYLAILLESYCSKHKDDRFYIAVNKLAGTFLKNRIQSVSKLIEVSEAKHKIIIYGESIFKLKTKLKEIGLYSGTLDQNYDGMLRKSVAAYQKKNKLPLTYLPDPVFLHHLFYQNSVNSK